MARTPFVLFLYLVWLSVYVGMSVGMCVCVCVFFFSFLSVVKTSVKIYYATAGSVTRVITVENE